MKNIKTQVITDVKRDGISIELLDDNFDVKAEIFRYDLTHEVIAVIYDSNLDNITLDKFYEIARRELQNFEDGTPLPLKFKIE